MRYKKKPKPSAPLKVIYDDREKRPWLFLGKSYEMEKRRLPVGDYSLEGYEDRVAIEKKFGLAELFTDLEGRTRPRFEKFLIKLSKYEVKCIIVEQELSDLYSAWCVLKSKAPKMQMTPYTIIYWVSKIIIDYGIPIVFVPKIKTDKERFVLGVFEQLQKKVKEM